MSLTGKIAVVTGAARGIGAQIALELGKNGAKVAINYMSESSKAAADKLVSDIRAFGTEALAIQVDISALSAPQAIVKAVLQGFKADHIDILVNNAGLGGNCALENVTVAEYESLMGVNVRSLIFMTQAVLPWISRGGRIINLSSVSARGGYPTQTIYAASKAAVEGLTRVWATELGQKYGITVNAINPGPVDTDMYRAAGPVHLANMEENNKKVPAAPRCGTVQDIAHIILFLSEERSRWITGDVICANGGMVYT